MKKSNRTDNGRSRSMLRWSMAVIAFICIAAVLADCQRRKTGSEGSAAAEKPAVDVARVEIDSVTLNVEWPGFLAAGTSMPVEARVNGTLIAQNFTGGQHVNAGDLLFRIDPAPYTDQVHKAEAALATAKSAYDYASSHYAAVCKAMEADAVSKMEVDQARSNMEQAEASIKSAQADLASARTSLGYCTIRATVSGRISSAGPSVGQYIAGEGSPVTMCTIYDDATVVGHFQLDDKVRAELAAMGADPAQAARIDLSKISLKFDEKLTHDYNGEITYTAPDVDRSTGTTLVKVKIRNPYGELRDGMYCRAVFPCGYMPDAMLVKSAAIGTDQLGRFMYVVNDSNKVVYTPVEVGQIVRDSMRIITKGMKPGDRYVSRALLKVRDGMTVTPIATK